MSILTSSTDDIEATIRELKANPEIRKVSNWRLHNSAEKWSEQDDEAFLRCAGETVDSYIDLYDSALSKIES